MEWVNSLPQKHFLPVDYSLHGCGRDLPEVRAVAHLHGARVPTKDDGYPEDWFAPGQSRTCHYPLEQESATLWYHDHAMGLNRLNIYAGLVGMMLLRDEREDSLGLPNGRYEIPLMLYDRNFSVDGQLYYPTSGIPGHPWVPEFDGDAILINGKIRPYVEVEPRTVSVSGFEWGEQPVLRVVDGEGAGVLADWVGPGIAVGSGEAGVFESGAGGTGGSAD